MIDPTFMSAVEWTDRMAMLLPQILPLKINQDEDWRAWAMHVLQSPDISRYNPPNPEPFAHWREWAYRFNQTVPLG